MQVASKWGTFVPNLDTLGLLVLELFFIYGTDGRTDRQTDRQTGEEKQRYGRRDNNAKRRVDNYAFHASANL